MSIPIVFKKADGKYYYYSDPLVEAKDAISIVIGPSNGLFRYANAMFDITKEITKEIKDASEVKTQAIFELPAVNYQTYRQVLAFLRAVYEKHKSEGAVLLTLNRNQPLLSQEYKVVVPTQVVGYSTVDYKDIDQIPMGEGEFLAGSIHSHPKFGAFQSGTDHKDEINFDGLHLTFGHIDRPVPEIHTRLCLAGTVYNNPQKTMILTTDPQGVSIEGYDLILSELVDACDKAGLILDKKEATKAILAQLSDKPKPDAVFPEEWLAKVSGKTTIVTNIANNYHRGDWRYRHAADANRALSASNSSDSSRAARDYLRQDYISDILRPWEYVTLAFKKLTEVSVPMAAKMFVSLSAIEPSKQNLQSFHITIMDTERK